MLLGIETAVRQAWNVSPTISSLRDVLVTWYVEVTSSIDFCQAIKSLKALPVTSPDWTHWQLVAGGNCLFAILCGRRIGLKNGYVFYADSPVRSLLEPIVGFIVEILREILRGRVQLDERRNVVDHLVV